MASLEQAVQPPKQIPNGISGSHDSHVTSNGLDHAPSVLVDPPEDYSTVMESEEVLAARIRHLSTIREGGSESSEEDDYIRLNMISEEAPPTGVSEEAIPTGATEPDDQSSTPVPAASPDAATPTPGSHDTGETAPSPDGFLQVLSSVLATPPEAPDNQVVLEDDQVFQLPSFLPLVEPLCPVHPSCPDPPTTATPPNRDSPVIVKQGSGDDSPTPLTPDACPISSNLDSGTRKTSLTHTMSSPGADSAPVKLRHIGVDSPLARRKNITSSPVRQRGELGVLQPLSPEHGTEMNEQYDFLRRTLSHSRRRYSTRGKRPNRKGRGQEEEQEVERSVVASNVFDASFGPVAQSGQSAQPSGDKRWRDILISSETPAQSSQNREETRVDHHGRTYIMDHSTRTIAFDQQRRRSQHGVTTSDLDTRRQMLERRYRSLNRSFRSSDRPRSGRAQRTASSNLDELSLTLTREEADAITRSNTLGGAQRSKSKKKKSRSGSTRLWPFGRRSSKTISQQRSTEDDDVIAVSTPSRERSITSPGLESPTRAEVRPPSPEVSDVDRREQQAQSSWMEGEAPVPSTITTQASQVSLSSEISVPGTPDSLISPIESGSPDEDHKLTPSPALRFITRKDLFSFLSSAGAAGQEFIASRALMELVQRIRADNVLLEKYQHSRHLVKALNRFADHEADLPTDWEKKLNQQGKVFFIDHKHKVTTYIDPRLPLPDTVFTYNTRSEAPVSSSQRRSALLSEEAELRSHHVTTVPSSPSIETMTSTASADSTTPPGSLDGSTPTETQPPTYEEQVVEFFRREDVVQVINSRYERGVRPQFQNIIDEVRLHGVPALERIQMSGSIATYELALVLSLFEEDIGRMQVTRTTPQTPPTPVPTVMVNPDPSPPQPAGISTLQRKKEAFSTKLQQFKIMMVRMGFAQGSRLKFNIRRDHLLEDAYEHMMKSDVKQLQTKRLNIAFKGEEGLDYGGPSREFFFLLSREIFNPYYGLFEYSANDTYTVQVNPTSEFLQNSTEWFKFAGRVMGLVIVQGFLVDAFFTRTVYKTFLSRPPTLKDLEALEPAFYNSLLWIRENDPEPLDLTFTVEDEAFGELRTHELKAGGEDIPVTEDNKEEYIALMLKWRLDRGVALQMEEMRRGFSEVMPPHLLVEFDAQELEFITAGTLEIDVQDWKTHTEYRNGYHAGHPVVLWFWRAVESFDNEQRLRLLQFVTGTSSVPFEGFKALRGSNGPKRFTIDYFNDPNAFPRTHTCFNRIDLPPYASYEVLHEKLLFAVQEGGGFGIE